MQARLSLKPKSLPRSLAISLALGSALILGGCDGNNDNLALTPAVPAPPADPGFTDSSPVPATAAFVDNYRTNITANASTSSNAVLSLLSGFSSLWTTGSAWNNGTPTTTGAPVLSRNVQYVTNITTTRTSAQADNAYYDDRRNQNYSVIDGLGPLSASYYAGAQATTSITSIPANATTVLYNEAGTGGGTTSSALGNTVSLINLVRGSFASTTPAKNYFQYPRPWRLNSSSVVVDTGTTDSLGYPVYNSSDVVVPALLPARSTTPSTDGGFPSGHTNAAYLAGIAMAYAIPERYQEMLTRASELGDNRIVAGMHSTFDVMGGRMMSTALAAATLYDSANAAAKSAAITQAHSYLLAQTGTTDSTFYGYAHSGTTATDRFADFNANRTAYTLRLTYGFSPVNATTVAAVVPKGAEVLLETRFPYLDATQRRVVLKTTEIPSGYPLLDDPEGWGRLNLVAAAEGYGIFNGNVVVMMDASQGGFNAQDLWRNDISGSGKLTKQGSGVLRLGGNNTWSGGTQIDGGTIQADSVTAFGKGDVYNNAGTVISAAAAALNLNGNYTQLSNGKLVLVLGASNQGKLNVAGVAAYGGTLNVKFQSGYKPSVGDTITLVTSGNSVGNFSTITVDGFKVTPTYSGNSLQIHIDATA